MLKLSIIIPTHKRPEILRKCLEHLEKQTIAKELEVIVVHDGEDGEDGKKAVSCQLPVRTAWPGGSAVSYIRIPKSHQGVARNRGVDLATAPIVLFIGDDIFLEPDACEIHLKAHPPHLSPLPPGEGGAQRRERGRAVLGFTTWDPAVSITPVMRWLERTGWQFGYPKIARYAHREIPQAIQHRFTYTSHVSLPTTLAKQIRFREDISLYGWEDIEWGLRLRNAGVKLFYEPDARAIHHHHITLEDSLKRMETLGRSLPHISKINPELDRMPHGVKLLVYRILALLPTVRGRHAAALLLGMKHAHRRDLAT